MVYNTLKKLYFFHAKRRLLFSRRVVAINLAFLKGEAHVENYVWYPRVKTSPKVVFQKKKGKKKKKKKEKKKIIEKIGNN